MIRGEAANTYFGLTWPIYNYGLTRPIYNYGLTRPIYNYGLTRPIHNYGLTRPIHNYGLTRPIHNYGLTRPIHNYGLTRPIYNYGLTQPIHNYGLTQPIYNYGLTRPIYNYAKIFASHLDESYRLTKVIKFEIFAMVGLTKITWNVFWTGQNKLLQVFLTMCCVYTGMNSIIHILCTCTNFSRQLQFNSVTFQFQMWQFPTHSTQYKKWSIFKTSSN